MLWNLFDSESVAKSIKTPQIIQERKDNYSFLSSDYN